MDFAATILKGSFVITLDQKKDDRGWFARTYNEQVFADRGINTHWEQMNHSFTEKKGTVRGMHFQVPPYKEIKLVRCTRGKVFDVIIDIREGSDTLFKWYGIELSADQMNMLYIPEGFAHGFQSLTDNCEMIYMHSASYQPGSESGIKYDDPMVNVKWPLAVAKISDKDGSHPSLNASFKGV